jgi:hypothetical protein
MPDELLYYNKDNKKIDKEEWSNLIRDASYTNEDNYTKHDLELKLSWVGVSWIKETQPKTWCLTLETLDELGYIQAVRNFVHGYEKATEEFDRVKGMMEDGSIFKLNKNKTLKRKPNEKK